MSLYDTLTESVLSWEYLGHPALLERFVLRNGKAYKPRKRIGQKRKAKQCYANAADIALYKGGGTYVEGFAVNNKFALPLLHAWITVDGADAMDPTLDAKDYEYYGVAFDKDTLLKEMLRNGHYGLLDTGLMLNTKLIFGIDPELEEICKRVKENRRSVA
jgi:hypothetical protein